MALPRRTASPGASPTDARDRWSPRRSSSRRRRNRAAAHRSRSGSHPADPRADGPSRDRRGATEPADLQLPAIRAPAAQPNPRCASRAVPHPRCAPAACAPRTPRRTGPRGTTAVRRRSSEARRSSPRRGCWAGPRCPIRRPPRGPASRSVPARGPRGRRTRRSQPRAEGAGSPRGSPSRSPLRRAPSGRSAGHSAERIPRGRRRRGRSRASASNRSSRARPRDPRSSRAVRDRAPRSCVGRSAGHRRP